MIIKSGVTGDVKIPFINRFLTIISDRKLNILKWISTDVRITHTHYK